MVKVNLPPAIPSKVIVIGAIETSPVFLAKSKSRLLRLSRVLPSDKGTSQNFLRTCTSKPRPKSGVRLS